MKSRKLVSRVLLLSLAVMLFAVPVLGQANSGKAVIYIGGSFNMGIPDGAQYGFFGIDMFSGKMLTNNLCLGVSAGFDIVAYSKDPYVDFTTTYSVIPVLLKARYYFSLNRMMQINLQVGAGAYSTIVKSSRGGDWNITRPGGSIGIGFDYWFLLTTGVSFEFEYHAFTLPDDGGTYDGGTLEYWQFRIDYGIIKF